MLRFWFILLIGLFLSSPSLAQKRVALVIGNSAYQHTPALANPKNDATDMAAALKQLGFQVLNGFDLDKVGLERKVRDFAIALQGAHVGVFFFAGHGLQVGGHNYLVPIDAQLSTASALDFETVRLDLVHRTMEREAQTNVMFLDACRDNPLTRNLARSMGTRSTEIGRGLAAVESGVGTLISFSTQPGNVALDGTGRNSPYAGSLVKHVSSSDDLGAILIAVRNDVMKDTQRKQIPWEHSALTGRFYFRPPTQTAVAERVPIPLVAARPPKYAVEQVGGLFSALDANRVQSLANKHQLPLPDFQIEAPSGDVSASLRRFVGIWIAPGEERQGRTSMLIVTRVDKEGSADGWWVYGPPGPQSTREAAGAFRFSGTITDESLRFLHTSGASYRHRLLADGRMDYFHLDPRRVSANYKLVPVWALVQAERAAKRKLAPTSR